MTLTGSTPTDDARVLDDLEALDALGTWDGELDPPPDLEVVDDTEASLPIRIAAPETSVDQSAIHGTGVFAERDFWPDELIERCPVLVVPPEQALAIADSVLGDYVYEWQGGYAVALGFGSLYNHSRSSNARYEMDYDAEEIHVVAWRAIRRGDEVTVNYNGDPTDTAPVWFEET